MNDIVIFDATELDNVPMNIPQQVDADPDLMMVMIDCEEAWKDPDYCAQAKRHFEKLRREVQNATN